jgi:hypothetical protein
MDTTTPGTPKRHFIAGVYNYCDHWCERCRFQQRCRLYRDVRRTEEAMARGEDLSKIEDLFDDGEEENPAFSDRQRADFLAWLDKLEPPSEDDLARISAVMDRRRELNAAHPLTRAARDYVDVAWPIIGLLEKALAPDGDPLVPAALETIGRFAGLINAKTRRAVNGLIHLDDPAFKDDDEFNDDNGPAYVQSDANGTAKLVRLLIAESRDAWKLLMKVQTIAADGVPAAMVRRLSELDASVAAAFPRALEFVRPGFDE